VPDGGSRPRIPGAYNATHFGFTANAVVTLDCSKNNFNNPDCAALNNMLGLYNGCVNSTTGICQWYNPLIGTNPQGLFVKNFNTWNMSSCKNNTTVNAAAYVAKVMGWVPFNEGCAANFNSLQSSDPTNFSTLLNTNYAAQLQDTYSYQTPSFNPYVQLIQSPTYIHESAYAYSVNDEVGFVQEQGTGIVMTFSGNGQCPARGLDLCVPLDRTKKVTVNLGELRADPAVGQWATATVCGSSGVFDIVADFPSFNFYPQPNELPCPVGIQDLAGQPYGFQVATPGPNVTLVPGSCFAPLPINTFWCTSLNVNGNVVQASSVTPGPRPSTHDLNGDGVSDNLWYDTSTGNVAVWLVQNGQIATKGPSLGNLSAYVPQLIAQRDIDRDGKADLLLVDGAGNAFVWFMNGVATVPPPNTVHPPTWYVGSLSGWSVARMGDFNGDGMGDLLLKNGNYYAVWLLDGTKPQVLNGNLPLGPVPGWQVVGTGDFNNDGVTDILWTTPAGDVAIWLMYGGLVKSNGYIGVGNVGTSWLVVGTGDFDGDGTADILFRDTSGDVAIWLMNPDGTVKSAAGLGNVPSQFSVISTGDYNRDGKSDILWRYTKAVDANNGFTSIWFMNGTTVASTASLGIIAPNLVALSNNAE
jgi:hypothetical protein